MKFANGLGLPDRQSGKSLGPRALAGRPSTGTASLGLQYVTKLVGTRQYDPGRRGEWIRLADHRDGDSGAAADGCCGPSAVFITSGKWSNNYAARSITRLDLRFSGIPFLLLVPFTFGAISTYENFVLNAYFWILTGVLFRLPHLAGVTQPAKVRPRRAGHGARAGHGQTAAIHRGRRQSCLAMLGGSAWE